MAAEPSTIFDPRRNFQLQGFTGRGATTTLHDASATGVSVSGIFQAAEDFAVLGFYNAYDYFNHLRQKHLPRTDLSGLILEFDIEYDHALDGAMRLDAAKYPSVSWDAMTFVCGKGGPGEIHEVKLLSYATVVSGGETPASVSVEASGTQAERGLRPRRRRSSATRFTIASRGASSTTCRSRSPRRTAPSTCGPSDLDPVTGELELKVGDTVYFTYDPLYEGDPPYALEEICHVTAVSGVTVTFDNTLPHGGPTHLPVVHAGTVRHRGGGERHPRVPSSTASRINLDVDVRARRRPQIRSPANIDAAFGAAGAEVVVDTVRRVRPDHVHEAGWLGRDHPVGRDRAWAPSASRPECTRAADPSTTSTNSPPQKRCGQEPRGHDQRRRRATSSSLARTSPA